MITPTIFIRDLSKTRESRQTLNLAMDQSRSLPRPSQTPPQQQPPQQSAGLPSRPSATSNSRMGPPQNIPSSLRPGDGGRNGMPPSGSSGAVGGPRPPPIQTRAVPGQPRPVPGQLVRAPPSHMAHGPGHAISPTTSQHKSSSDDLKKEKKKKKLGLF